MAASPKSILDLSAAGLKKIEKRDGVGVKHLILDNNELNKLENLDCFPDLEKLSASGNALIRMFPVSKCRYLTHINLSNNGVVCIEGMKDLQNLTFLNLSVNRIKVIQNFVPSENLTHVDLSKNDITRLDSMACLTKLKTLHLSGNKISHLEKASQYLPASLCVLSLADNNIEDLNEVSYLVGLECLEQLTISGNPCVTSNAQLGLPIFDYRPFVINWCLGLRLLDGYVATQKESLKAEWLYSQGKGRHFKPGENVELVEYLAQVCPVNSDKLVEEEDEKLSRILHMQRQHKEQFLSEISLASQPEQPAQMKRKTSRMTHSYHASESTTIGTSSQHNSNEPSRIMYESAPEVLFDNTEQTQSPPPSTTSDGSPHLLSKSERLHNSARSPITIEQVTMDAEKAKSSCITKPTHSHSEERRLRPASAEVTSSQPKGPLVRKVSRRSTSPNVSSPSPGRPKVPTSYRSKISPSRSCILSAKLSINKNSSESDTSEELSNSSKSLHQNIRRGVKQYSSSQTCSPVFRQKLNSEPTSSKEGIDLDKTATVAYTGPDEAFLRKNVPASVIYSRKFGLSEEKLCNAAIKIQSVWRGYYVRHCNPKVYKLRQEIRFRRMEDHVQHLHGHMCRLTDFVLRQQKDLQHERELRKMQAEDIRNLHEKAKELEKDVALILMKAKQNEFQKVSEHYSYDIQNLAFSRKCISKDNKCLPGFDHGRLLQDISPDSPSSLQYSTQTFQENSGLFSPSSQTSSATSVGPDGTFSQTLSQHCLQPSTSDLSDADSGLHSMVSPNLSAFIEAEKNACSDGAANSVSDNYHASLIASLRAQHRRQLAKSVSDNQDKSFLDHGGRKIRQQPLELYPVLPEDNYQPLAVSQAGVQNQVVSTDVESSMANAHSVIGTTQQLNHISNSHSGSKEETSVETAKSQVECRDEEDEDAEPQKDSDTALHNGPVNVQKKDASLSPIFPYPSAQCLSNSGTAVMTHDINKQHIFDPKHPEICLNSCTNFGSGKECPENDGKTIDSQCFYGKSSILSKMEHTKRFSDPAVSSLVSSNSVSLNSAPIISSPASSNPASSGFSSAKESMLQAVCALDEYQKSEKSRSVNITKARPTIFNKSLVQGMSSNSSTPLDDCNSPQSPCTVEMSGRISHSCSFQSDGFTTAEELSATTTVKLFSARTMSMHSNPQSPQTAIQRPLSLNEPASQGTIHSPLVLATHIWEKKVQDIESTFQHLQTQIRELEGAFGQVGQLSQFLYPSLLSDDSKDARHLIHCIDQNTGSLVLDMPKVNFKRANNGNGDLFLQTHFAHHGANGVPFLPPSSTLPQSSAQNNDYCCIEELEQDAQNLTSRAKCLKLPLHDKGSNDANTK